MPEGKISELKDSLSESSKTEKQRRKTERAPPPPEANTKGRWGNYGRCSHYHDVEQCYVNVGSDSSQVYIANTRATTKNREKSITDTLKKERRWNHIKCT